jgi:hypothetical protein
MYHLICRSVSLQVLSDSGLKRSDQKVKHGRIFPFIVAICPAKRNRSTGLPVPPSIQNSKRAAAIRHARGELLTIHRVHTLYRLQLRCLPPTPERDQSRRWVLKPAVRRAGRRRPGKSTRRSPSGAARPVPIGPTPRSLLAPAPVRARAGRAGPARFGPAPCRRPVWSQAWAGEERARLVPVGPAPRRFLAYDSPHHRMRGREREKLLLPRTTLRLTYAPHEGRAATGG